MRIERLIVGTVLLLTAAGVPAALYKWVDENGRIQYSDKPPASAGKGGVEMSNRGVVRKKLDAGLSPDEKKAKDEEAERRRNERQEALARQRADHALLQSFTSVQEIDMKRDRELQAIDVMIANLKSQERSLVERWGDEKRRADNHAKRGKPLPDALKEDLARSQNEIKIVREEVQRRHQEAADTKVKYEALKKRYLELRQPGAASDVMPAAAPASASAVPAQKPPKK